MASPTIGPLVGNSDATAGVIGTSKTDDGVVGRSTSAFGVFGASVSGVGIRAVSETGVALQAQAKGNGIGVDARSIGGVGVSGVSETSDGVSGRSTSAFGVFGASESGVGIRAVSGADRPALEAQAKGNGSGVVAVSDHGGDGVSGTSGTGVGVHGIGGRLAGFFEGHVQVTGDFRGAHVFADRIDVKDDVVLSGGDCAEHFDTMPDAMCEPGTVMAISNGGALNASARPYDKKVAGVISGAGSFRPAVILDRQPSNASRPPVALVGKVYCKVDARYGAIEIGDLLTSSATLGHAMKVSDPSKAFGAVIGKALGSLSVGTGLIPILIAMQ